MTNPLVSVVIETITARLDTQGAPLPDVLAEPVAAIGRQSYPAERIETIVVLDDQVSAVDVAEIKRRYPQVVLAQAHASNYFAAKNTGAATASGEFVVFLDGDCVPECECLERLIARFEPDIAVVAGKVRYTGTSWSARLFSIPDFAYIVTEEDGQANGLNLSNSAFRREVLLKLPLDERINRNGGCYQLFHRLRATGARAVYEPSAIAYHGIDCGGLGFFSKHYQRGYDGVAVYRLDRNHVFRGTAWVDRLGLPALVALAGRRIVVDWARLVRHRQQIGISPFALPVYALVGAGLRCVELAGGIAAFFGGRGKGKLNAQAEAGGTAA